MHTIRRVTGDVLEVRLVGTVNSDDYEAVIPVVESNIERQDTVRMVWDMSEVTGIEPSSIWQDVVFDMRHRTDFERIAVIGDKRRRSWASQLFEPMNPASVFTFGVEERALANIWVRGEGPPGDQHAELR